MSSGSRGLRAACGITRTVLRLRICGGFGSSNAMSSCSVTRIGLTRHPRVHRVRPARQTTWPKKHAKCCFTRRYSVVCSGRCRSWWTGAPSGARWACRPMAGTRCKSKAWLLTVSDSAAWCHRPAWRLPCGAPVEVHTARLVTAWVGGRQGGVGRRRRLCATLSRREVRDGGSHRLRGAFFAFGSSSDRASDNAEPAASLISMGRTEPFSNKS